MDPLFKLIEKDYENKVEIFKNEKHEPGKIVFIGDSMISFWDISKNIKNKNIINWGIGGDTTIGVLNRLDMVIKIKPKIVLLSIGSNDLVRIPNTTIADIAYRINLIKNTLESNIPNVEVYILSVSPVLDNHEITKESYLRERTNEQINEINDLVSTYTDIIDVSSHLKDENVNLKVTYTSDGLHLNAAGYAIYAQQIAKAIPEIEII